MRLSFQSGLYPRAFTLSGISRGDEPVASGSFGEIWQGDFHGQPVCLKIARVYQNQTSSRERLVQVHLVLATNLSIRWLMTPHAGILKGSDPVGPYLTPQSVTVLWYIPS